MKGAPPITKINDRIVRREHGVRDAHDDRSGLFSACIAHGDQGASLRNLREKIRTVLHQAGPLNDARQASFGNFTRIVGGFARAPLCGSFGTFLSCCLVLTINVICPLLHDATSLIVKGCPVVCLLYVAAFCVC